MGATVVASKRRSILGGTLSLAGSASACAIGSDAVIVGRDAKCTLVVDDAQVSALHAEFLATDRGVRVRDLGSMNGTWVGDTRVEVAYLTAEADVWVGQTELAFEPSRPKRVEVPATDQFGPLYGASESMRALFAKLERVAPTELSVLVLGETGTGKELIASGIHAASARKRGPFVVVDCGAIPATLAEATLFGHERGAFTGAVERRVGPFVEANGGTIFLDELGELPLEVQPKLLRVLAERRVKAVGASRYADVDVRVLAATRRDLRADVNAGAFRSDLFFRVAQLSVEVPRLRDRLEDVPGLVSRMLGELGRPGTFKRVSTSTLEQLTRHDWPGNVRELKNAVSVAFAMADPGAEIDIATFVGQLSSGPSPTAASMRGAFRGAKQLVVDAFEREYFAALSAQTGGNVSEMSRISGLERAHVRRHLRRHGLKL